MFRRLLAVVATLALPAMLVAQARPAASTSKAVHPSANQRQGEVVRPATADRPRGDVDHNAVAGEKNQATGDKDETQGSDAKEGPQDATEGPDVEAQEGPEGEGPDAKDVQQGHQDAPDVERSEKGDKQDETDGSKPVAPSASRHNSRVGSHKP